MSIRPKDLIPPVFVNITKDHAKKILEANGASAKKSKEVFLLRESAELGLLAITFKGADSKEYKHIRIGLTPQGWAIAPVKAEELKEFTKNSARIFRESPKLLSNLESLFVLLEKKGFQKTNMILPPKEEASDRYGTTYLDLEDDDLEDDEQRYLSL